MFSNVNTQPSINMWSLSSIDAKNNSEDLNTSPHDNKDLDLNSLYGSKEIDQERECSNDNMHKSVQSISLWTERWFLSSNAKDIGTLYLIFALFSGLIGTGFSVLIRLELSGPGVQYISDNQLYNSIITAHAILMIFFMVENKILNSQFISFF